MSELVCVPREFAGKDAQELVDDCLGDDELIGATDDARITAGAKVGLELGEEFGANLGVGRLIGDVVELVRILLQVMEKLVISFIQVAHVFELFITQSFEGWNAMTHREMLMKGFCSPIARFILLNDGLKTSPLVAAGNINTRPIEKGRGC